MYAKFLWAYGTFCQLIGFNAGFQWANRKAIRVVRQQLEELLRK